MFPDVPSKPGPLFKDDVLFPKWLPNTELWKPGPCRPGWGNIVGGYGEILEIKRKNY